AYAHTEKREGLMGDDSGLVAPVGAQMHFGPNLKVCEAGGCDYAASSLVHIKEQLIPVPSPFIPN
ncbi:uncharacterized, partial [Tachysurus ichikawai]